MENIRGGGVSLDYWLQWQVAVCALMIITATATALRYLLLNRSSDTCLLRASELWVPCWCQLSPVWLLVYRALSFLVTFAVLYEVVVELRGAFAFYFYTQWTFALVMIYFALATIISAHECWTHSRKLYLPGNGETDRFMKKSSGATKFNNSGSHDAKESKAMIKLRTRYSQEELEHEAGFLGNLMQAIYQTCAGAVMLADLVFWCLLLPFLLPEDFKITFIIWCTHGLNAILLIIDSGLNSQPLHWHGFAYFVLWSASYIIFQWALHVCCFTWWPYPFLELSTPWAPLWYFGMALIHVPCYGVYVLLIKTKGFIFFKMFPHAFVRSLSTTKMMPLGKKQT